MANLGTFLHDGLTLAMQSTTYHDKAKATAIVLFMEDGQPYTTLTVNLPNVNLAENEILVKTWSENSDLAQDLLAKGVFKDTGKRVPTGHVYAEIWEM